jgi:hypothetical protein
LEDEIKHREREKVSPGGVRGTHITRKRMMLANDIKRYTIACVVDMSYNVSEGEGVGACVLEYISGSEGGLQRELNR